MRNNITSLEKYFSIFAHLSPINLGKIQCRNNSTLNFPQIVTKQLIEKEIRKNIYVMKLYYFSFILEFISS